MASLIMSRWIENIKADPIIKLLKLRHV